jgi:hypothetical protein
MKSTTMAGEGCVGTISSLGARLSWVVAAALLLTRGLGGAAPAAVTNQVEIRIEGGQRVIRANGLPDHAAGHFPNRNNPNRIGAQAYVFRMPLKPVIAERPTALRMHPLGWR